MNIWELLAPFFYKYINNVQKFSIFKQENGRFMTQEEIEKENKEIAREYKELLSISYQTLNDEDNKLIRKAFDVAVDAHKDQRRKSGEAYIFHPIAVAKIVASEIGLGSTAIAAALMHDVVEDTDITVEDIQRMFNPRIAKIVEGLTKISRMEPD